MNNKVRILVVIVTYNAMQWVDRCFESLRKSSVVPDIYVVDNGSSDGTQAYILKHFSEVIFNQSDVNLGFGKANNQGLQYAIDNKYDFVYLLNQDAWVLADTLERLAGLSIKYPDYGILSPFQMQADLYHIDRDFVSNVLAWKSNSNICSDMYNMQLTEVYSVTEVMAAHWFLPITTIKKVGGFSPSFQHYAEDDNYIDRTFFYGLKVGVVPSLRVIHDRGRRKDSKQKIMYMKYTSSIRLLSRPDKKPIRTYIKVMYHHLRDVISFRSLRPLNYAMKITANLASIIKNRLLSMTTYCAFLQISEE